MELVTMKVDDLTPYENNPRRNDEAVESVKESIRQCGYVAPIIVDENNVILAGHTRRLALIELGIDSAQVLVKKGLTEEQKRKYRLLDNKVAELAGWDFEKLEQELEGLDFGGFDFGFDKGGDFIEDLEENDFGLERNEEKETFCITVTFPVDFKQQVDDYMKKIGGRDGIANMILEEARKNA